MNQPDSASLVASLPPIRRFQLFSGSSGAGVMASPPASSSAGTRSTFTWWKLTSVTSSTTHAAPRSPDAEHQKSKQCLPQQAKPRHGGADRIIWQGQLGAAKFYASAMASRRFLIRSPDCRIAARIPAQISFRDTCKGSLRGLGVSRVVLSDQFERVSVYR